MGLGPAGPDLVTAEARRVIGEIPVRFVRTRRHPAAAVVGDAATFDHLYETSEDLPETYRRIAEALVTAARRDGTVLYAVPGSPVVAERTVELLRADDRVEVTLVAGLSFTDLAFVRLGVDPVAAGAHLVDGQRFTVEAAGRAGPFLVAQCDHPGVLSDIKLAVDDPDAPPVTVLFHLGLPDERLITVPWDEMDRTVEPDHLTSLWIPRLATPVAAEMARFAELVARLRAECPWDAEQTHASLRRYLLEEAHEALEALDALPADPALADPAFAALAEELGDLLFQIVFHSVLAAEEGQFTLTDVIRGIHDKLVARHPHVFGEAPAADADEVAARWERLKSAEKGPRGPLEGIPPTLPALTVAEKVLTRLERAGAAPTGPTGGAPVAVGPSGAVDADAVGDALLAVVAAARRAGIDPEAALRARISRLARDAGGSPVD